MPVNLSCFPKVGVCPNNNSHQIARVLPSNSKSFVKHQQCSKCLSPFDKTKYNGYYVSTHYYQCNECPIKICFQCAQPAQPGNKWNPQYLPSPMQKHAQINVGWLKVNDALNSLSDDGLNEILKETIKLFGGARKTMQFITKNASRYDLQSIYRLTLKQQQQDSEKNNKVQHQKLESLPSAMHSNILGYLDKEDIKSFKMCSRRISILCLTEMRRVTIGFIDGDKLLKNSNGSFGSLSDHTVKKRHNRNKSVLSLCREWSRSVDIPQNDQILYEVESGRLSSLRHLLNSTDASKKVKKSTFCMLNKNQTVSLRKRHKPALFDQCRPTGGHLSSLTVLQYFDVKKQRAKIVQFIICDNIYDIEEVITDYFENSFIEVDGVDNEWYRNLKKTLNEMGDDPQVDKLIWHSTSKAWALRLLTVQINPKHAWCQSNWYHLNGIRYFNQLQKTPHIASFEDKEILTECLQKYYEKNLSKGELKIFQPELDTMFDLINAKYVVFKVASRKELDEKLCKSLDYRVKPDWLSYDYSRVRHKSLQIIFPWRGPMMAMDERVCRINVFYSEDCPYTYQFGLSPAKVVNFKYMSTFGPMQFIEDLFETISKSTDHIFYDYCKEFVDAYYADKKKKNPNVKCMLYESEHSVRSFHSNLYMTPIISELSEKSAKLTIRFIVDKGLKYIGLPIDVWINKKDTLRFIVHKYLKRIKELILSCYKVKEHKQKVLIHRHKWGDFKMTQRMNLPNDILVFMLDERKMTNISLPVAELTTTYYLPDNNN